MYLPDYHDGSIVNVMSSLLRAFGGTSDYAPFSLLPPASLSKTGNVVLLVLDGFGYEFLCSQPSDSIFHQHLKARITSVFPSTTAAGVTTFLTGLAPQQHAVTGWFMHLKEVGAVTTTLRFRPRCCDASLAQDGVHPGMFYGRNHGLFEQMRRQTYSLHPREITDSPYNLAMNDCPQKIPFSTFSECVRKIQTLVISNQEEKFILAYWDGIDALSHKHGTQSAKVIRHYYEIAEMVTGLAHILAGTDTTLIITADHGLLDGDRSKTIEVKHHPQLRETLVLPLCGEPRVAFCYVRPAKTRQFERYVISHFDRECELYRSEELIHQNWFGLFEPDSRLFDRIGDYVLVMRDNYLIKDFLTGEPEKFQKADHGGVSKEEMFVPLVVIHV